MCATMVVELGQYVKGKLDAGFYIAAGRLIHFLPEWSFRPTPMYLIYAQDTRPTAKLRSVIDFLVQRFGLNEPGLSG